MLKLTGVAITLAFTGHCFSIWICVDGAWTSLPIPLITKAYMTKSHSWLEHILPSSSSWCSRLGCSWSFHHWCGHHFPVCPAYHCSLVDSQIWLVGSAWCGLTQPTLDDFTVYPVTVASSVLVVISCPLIQTDYLGLYHLA